MQQFVQEQYFDSPPEDGVRMWELIRVGFQFVRKNRVLKKKPGQPHT